MSYMPDEDDKAIRIQQIQILVYASKQTYTRFHVNIHTLGKQSLKELRYLYEEMQMLYYISNA